MLEIIKIGLDIDNTLNIRLTQNKIFRYKHLIERFNVYQSAGGNGLHFEIYLKKPITISKSFELREELGDDKARLMFSRADFERGWDFDILFTYKKIYDSKTKSWNWKKRQFIKEVVL